MLGVRGTALSWSVTPYLTVRKIITGFSEWNVIQNLELNWGVPQGSCLGPLLFIIYSSKLFEIIKLHLPYADDTPLYLSFSPNEGGGNGRKFRRNSQMKPFLALSDH